MFDIANEVDVALVSSEFVEEKLVVVAFVKRPLVMMALVAPRFVVVAPVKSPLVTFRLVDVAFVAKRLPAVSAEDDAKVMNEAVVPFTFNTVAIVVEPEIKRLPPFENERSVVVAQSRVDDAMEKS